jgi:hypothetical protein
MTRRALDELEALERDGLVEPRVATRLRDWYEARSRQAEHDAKAALGAAQISEQLVEAVRRLAEAERRGVREAEHAEIVDVEVAEHLDREIVMRLVALDEAAENGAHLPEVLDRLLDTEAQPQSPTQPPTPSA